MRLAVDSEPSFLGFVSNVSVVVGRFDHDVDEDYFKDKDHFDTDDNGDFERLGCCLLVCNFFALENRQLFGFFLAPQILFTR